MPNGLEYSLYTPADNVGHEREAGFCGGGVLSVHMAGELFLLYDLFTDHFFGQFVHELISATPQPLPLCLL